MALLYRRLRSSSNFLPQLFSGYPQYRRVISSSDKPLIPLPVQLERVDESMVKGGWYAHRFSTTPVESRCSPPKVDLLPFIQSTFDEIKGPHHCWLNKVEGDIKFSNKDGTFLILAGQFLYNFSKSGSDILNMLEKVKSIQQRFPQISVVGLQPGCSISSAADHTNIIQLIMKEYITFPILLSDNNISEIEDGACYILFKDSGSPTLYREKDLDLITLIKAIEELGLQSVENARVLNEDNTNSIGFKPLKVIKEPNYCSYMQNLLLYYPGCISSDENGTRLFLSDSNHHRIIILDANGKIIDCIGSSPGFEDGEFDNAKLLRPAATFYDDAEDCLYFVDAENHAIRRANMESRVLETIYPISNLKKEKTMWTRIKDKLGLRRDVDVKSQAFDSRSMMFPWHLMKSEDDNLLVINRSFETLWSIDSASGKITEVFTGFQNILEIFGPLIMEKISPLEKMPSDWLQKQVDCNFSVEGFEFASLMSSLTTYEDHVIICDTVGQRILKFDEESGVFSDFQLSNFGVLGLPYWLSFPMEKIYLPDGFQCSPIDHIEHFNLLPGKTSIRLNINIPSDTELAEPIHESSMWRRAKGAAVVISGFEDLLGLKRVGMAQQYYDNMEKLNFEEVEVSDEDEATLEIHTQDEGNYLDCVILTSPGTSEIVIQGALYLKLKGTSDLPEDCQEKYAARIADILSPESDGETRKDSIIRSLLKSNRDMRDIVFVRPLHVKLHFECPFHPKDEYNERLPVITESMTHVDVSL